MKKKILFKNSLLTWEVATVFFFFHSLHRYHMWHIWMTTISPHVSQVHAHRSHVCNFSIISFHHTLGMSHLCKALIKCAKFCPSTQNAMNKVSGGCWWQFSWAFLHKSVMQYTQYMYICVIVITVLNVISKMTCLMICV